jgi:hypothetical protein
VLDEAGLDLLVSMAETVDLALAEIHDDASSPERVHGPDSCNELVLGARRVEG